MNFSVFAMPEHAVRRRTSLESKHDRGDPMLFAPNSREA
jgi:hypothetical protein